ncbi:enoyl-CoA hydratase/isomerase family protein [Rhodococcus sp. NPDC059968]|uniref:enoyl-CoA hydratase/isomerase family protein n=1 Tax=Rhodococcus sp. NPDC059968 TaxID=3347017 RepID=UPI0036730A64
MNVFTTRSSAGQSADTGACDYGTIEISGEGPVRHLRLNRPHRHNAQTTQMWRELTDVGRVLCDDDTVRAVIVYGSGRSFSSGIDLEEVTTADGFIRRMATLPEGDPDPITAHIVEVQRAFAWIRTAPFIVIAAVHGHAIGIGFELALACDIRLVADTARMALREIDYGLIPDAGGTAWLRDIVGRERALHLILTAQELSGRRAVEWGLALQSLPEADLIGAAEKYADHLAGLPRATVAHTKRAVHEQNEAASIRLAAEGQAACIRVAIAEGAASTPAS